MKSVCSIQAFWQTEESGGKVWPYSRWLEEVLMKEQDGSEKNIIIWLAWCFIGLY